jgi:hypothetical protein
MRLPRHRTETADLPEQPLIDLDASPFVRGIELPCLAPEILEDGTRLEDRDRFAAGPSGSTIVGIRLLGEIRRKSGLNCSPRLMLIGFSS